jgi:hypothetical protein
VEGDLPDLILPPVAAPVQTAGLTEEAILDRLVAELVAGEEKAEEQTQEPTGGAPADGPTEAAGAGPANNAGSPYPTNGAEMKSEAATEQASAEIVAGVAVLEAEEEAVETQEEFEPVDPEPEPAMASGTVEVPQSHWLLSLYTPAAGDTVDWRRGNYTVLTRGGRVESAAGSGELKKQVQMIAEGSVLTAATEPCGASADVGPEGFPHPVYRAGFALAIPLPGVR